MTAIRKSDSRRLVEFSIDVDGKNTICWISFEALRDHFGATDNTDAETLLRCLDRIAPVAAKVARRTPPGKRILVRTTDF